MCYNAPTDKQRRNLFMSDINKISDEEARVIADRLRPLILNQK